ncbi:unnamed protein product, partial [Durusdinium trenchii]
MSAMASVATVPVSFGTQQPDGSTFYGSFEAQTTYPSRGSFMPPSPPPPAPRALSRPRVSGVQSPLPPLVQPKGDVAPMLPERSPCGPMKSLDPPGLIAAGIPWLDSLSPWQPTRPPSPMPVARARSVSPCPSPIHRVVRTTRHAAPCASCCRAPVPILPSTARSITRMVTTPSQPPVRSYSRSPSPTTRLPSPDLRGAHRAVDAPLPPASARRRRKLKTASHSEVEAKVDGLEEIRRWEARLGAGPEHRGSSDTSTDATSSVPLSRLERHVFRRKLFAQELAQIERLLSDEGDLRSAAAQ